MGKTVDVAVIGGGVVGVCAAYYLARHGRKVVVLDEGQVGEGCSYANACLITPSHALPVAAPGVITQALKWLSQEDSPLLIRPRLDPRLFRWLIRFARACRADAVNRVIPILRDLSRASLALFEELIAAEGLTFDFERRGLLGVYKTEAGFAKGLREAELLRRHGFVPKVLDGNEARKLEPALGEIRGAVYHEEDAHGNCYRFVREMSEAARRSGVEFSTGTKVTAVTQDGTALSVRTTGGDYVSKDVIFAAGSWTPLLLRGLGAKLPVEPGKGYSVTMDRPAGSPAIPLLNMERKVGITPIGNRLRFAGTMEFAGLDLTLNPTRSDAVLRGGLEVLADAGQPTNVERWCGLRPCTPDTLPVIDRLPRCPHAYVCTGHGMLGFTLGPISGKLVADLIVSGRPSMDIGSLSIGRF